MTSHEWGSPGWFAEQQEIKPSRWAPLPFRMVKRKHGYDESDQLRSGDDCSVFTSNCTADCSGCDAEPFDAETGAYIVAAANNYPLLLSECVRLQARIDRLVAAGDELDVFATHAHDPFVTCDICAAKVAWAAAKKGEGG